MAESLFSENRVNPDGAMPEYKTARQVSAFGSAHKLWNWERMVTFSQAHSAPELGVYVSVDLEQISRWDLSGNMRDRLDQETVR